MLRKIIYIGLMSCFFLTACSKKPWGNYIVPVDLLDAKERTDTTLIKVVSVTLWHTNSLIPGVIDMINSLDPDFVLVREADHDNTRSGRGVKQGELVAIGTNMEHYYGGSQVYNQGLYGLAMLSKYPIIDSSKVQFSGSRPVATITAQFPDDKKFDFVGAQFDDRAGDNYTAIRVEHASLLLNNTKGLQNPAMLAVSFYMDNPFYDPTLNVLYEQFESGCYNCDFNYPAANPNIILDHIMYKKSRRYDVTVKKYEVLPFPTGVAPRALLVYSELEIVQ